MRARDELNSARGHRPRAAARHRRGPRPLRDLQLAARPRAGRVDPQGPRRPAAAVVAGGLGRARASASAARVFPVEPVLAARRHAGVLRRAGGVRACRPDRRGAGGGGRPLRPAVPVRVRALLRRRLPAGARAGPRARRGGGRRGGVRVRALPPRAGRAPARDLERRHPFGVRGVGARLPAAPPGMGPRGIRDRCLAVLDGSHARPALHIPAVPDRRHRTGRLVATLASAARSRPDLGHGRRRRRLSGDRRIDRASVPARGGRAEGRRAPTLHRRGVLRPAHDLRHRSGREPAVGRGDRGDPGRPPEPAGEDALPGPR